MKLFWDCVLVGLLIAGAALAFLLFREWSLVWRMAFGS
jgi:hypothetical protein